MKIPTSHLRAFTLIEILVSVVIISTIMTIATPFIMRANELRKLQLQRIYALESARNILETIRMSSENITNTGELDSAQFLSQLHSSLVEPKLKLTSVELNEPVPHLRITLKLSWLARKNQQTEPVSLFIMKFPTPAEKSSPEKRPEEQLP